MRDFWNRLASALVAATLILFAGYMCGAPITEPDSSNFPAYLMALAFGALFFTRPWRYA